MEPYQLCCALNGVLECRVCQRSYCEKCLEETHYIRVCTTDGIRRDKRFCRIGKRGVVWDSSNFGFKDAGPEPIPLEEVRGKSV